MESVRSGGGQPEPAPDAVVWKAARANDTELRRAVLPSGNDPGDSTAGILAFYSRSRAAADQVTPRL
jgi:hypothetical protein